MSDVAFLKEFTKAPLQRLEAMRDALLYIEHERLKGDIAECGVWKAGHIMLARTISPHRRCWLYDTFDEGLTAPGEHDVTRSGRRPKNKEGEKGISIPEVMAGFARFGLLDESKLVFVRGKTQETLQLPWALPEQLVLLRLDTNWYESTKVELEVLWPRLVPGGILIIDDYGHWMGAKKAVNEFFATDPPRMQEIDYSARLIVKPYRSS